MPTTTRKRTKPSPEETLLRRVCRMLNRIGKAQAAILNSIQSDQEEARRSIFGGPTHRIPTAERDMHIAHPDCLCSPIRNDRLDGPTLWMHRMMVN